MLFLADRPICHQLRRFCCLQPGVAVPPCVAPEVYLHKSSQLINRVPIVHSQEKKTGRTEIQISRTAPSTGPFSAIQGSLPRREIRAAWCLGFSNTGRGQSRNNSDSLNHHFCLSFYSCRRFWSFTSAQQYSHAALRAILARNLSHTGRSYPGET